MRSPARRAVAAAAIASSTVWGVSITGTAIPASAASADRALGGDAAADRDRGLARRMRPLGDPQRGLAEGRLLVDPALAGDRRHPIARASRRSRSPPSPGRPPTRCEACEPVLDRQQPEADATGRAGARRVALTTARRTPPARRPSRRSSSRGASRRGRGALLRSVDRRRALRSEERVRRRRTRRGGSPRRGRGSSPSRPPSACDAAPVRHRSWRCHRCPARSVSPPRRSPRGAIAGPDAARGDRVTLQGFDERQARTPRPSR